MKPIRDFLIQVSGEFENEKVVGGIKIFLSSIYEDAHQQKKYAEVLETPIIENPYGITKGDIIFFKHTILRGQWLQKDKKTPSQFLVDPVNNIYRVPVDTVFAYMRDGELFCTDQWVIVEPIKVEEKKTDSGIIIPSFNKEEKQIGTITHIGSKLKDLEYNVGDTVIWNLNSEYEVKLDDKVHYRMHYTWIIGKYVE